MDRDTVDAIYALLDCLRESNERARLIVMDMKMQADWDLAVFVAGAITALGLLVVTTLWSARLDRSARVAGAAATVVLIGVLSVKVPDWPTASKTHDVVDGTSAARHQLAEIQCPETPLDEER